MGNLSARRIKIYSTICVKKVSRSSIVDMLQWNRRGGTKHVSLLISLNMLNDKLDFSNGLVQDPPTSYILFGFLDSFFQNF